MYKKAVYFFVFSILILCSFVLAACYSDTTPPVTSYRVEYFVNNKIYYTGEVENGVLTSLPQNPEVNGYIFDGWFLDNKTWKKPLTVNSLLNLPLSGSNTFKVFAKLTKNRCDLENTTHSFDIIEKLDPTCTERGYKLEKCKNCAYEKNTILQQLDHDYISQITQEPKCNVEGLKVYICQRENCNHTYSQPIAALQHNYIVQITKQPTCEENGEKTYSCLRENCNHSYTEVISKLQHSLVSTITKQPCVTEGLKTFSCSRHNCSHSYTEILPALGYHDCDENGNCIRCQTTNVCSKNFVANGNTLTEYNGTETNVIIPSMFNGVEINKLEYTFLEKETIQSVYIPDTIEIIGISTFDGCLSLKRVRMSCNLKIIDSFAFTKTAITSIYIPKSLTNINMYAFYDCSQLQTVYYEGTQTLWNNISIANKNTDLTEANLICDKIIQPDTVTKEPIKKNNNIATQQKKS